VYKGFGYDTLDTPSYKVKLALYSQISRLLEDNL